MRYSIHKIAEITGGYFLQPPNVDAQIEHIILDSRQVIFPASSIFLALKGRRHDGHDFVQDLYQNGVRHFLVSQKPEANVVATSPNANFLVVPNTQQAFHELAKWHRQQFALPVIGITGSNGKTVVKEWLFQLMHPEYHIVRSPRSFNSQTGVPLSVLQINADHQLGIFEAGISQLNEMNSLAKILVPDIGILTNIGDAHSEGFPNIETKLREKTQLFYSAEKIIYCLDDALILKSMNDLLQARLDHPPQCISWSATGKSASVQVEYITAKDANSTELKISAGTFTKVPDFKATVPFTDAASIQNSIHCVCLMLSMGYEPSIIASRLSKLEPVAMRLELKEGINGCTIINDTYNSDLTSLTIALNFLEQQNQPLLKKNLKRTLILSDILQSGKSPEMLYAKVAGLIAEKRIDRFIGIGSEVASIRKELPASMNACFYATTPDLLENFADLNFRDEFILLKGARKFGFEQIANRLATRIHQTTLEVNLSALLHNLRMYQSHLNPGTRLMVMVKASAYGSGSSEVAKLLEFQHVDYLGVAYADEGVELRKAGVQLPIMVMNPEETTFEALVRYRLEPEMYSLGILKKFQTFLKKHPSLSENYLPAIHLKLETGMKRLGFEKEDLTELIRELKNPLFGNTFFTVKSIFSHLAGSEAKEHDEFTKEQFSEFSNLYEQLASSLGYRPLRHILNSSGILRFPNYQMEMVRLGLGLYGIDSSGILQSKLQTVNTLKATVSQIKKANAGETIGYGRKGRIDKPSRIATISIGYADGLLRKAGNGRFSVLIGKKRAPIIGNVCMDMIMADVTDIPELREGDSVIIFGKSEAGGELRVEELANVLDTIPYEVFTSISGRVKRVYVQE